MYRMIHDLLLNQKTTNTQQNKPQNPKNNPQTTHKHTQQNKKENNKKHHPQKQAPNPTPLFTRKPNKPVSTVGSQKIKIIITLGGGGCCCCCFGY